MCQVQRSDQAGKQGCGEVSGQDSVTHFDALSAEGDKYGILMTPTIVVKDKVVSIGKVPSEDDIEKMIKKEME